MNRKFLSLTLIAYTVTLLASGCASLPRKTTPIKFASQHRVLINSVPYLPSEEVSGWLRGTGRWDLETQVWSLTVGPHELKTAPEMSVALVDKVPVELRHPPVMQAGKLFLPERLWADWLLPWAPVLPRKVATPIKRFRKVVIDAGHGGKDPGAIGRSGLQEKTVTLDIAKRLRDLLAREGFQVVMTRSDDRFIPLARRSEIANREGADLFISVHANAARRRSVSGYEAYYLSQATDDHARAVAAAENAFLPTNYNSGLANPLAHRTQAIIWDLLYTEHRSESTELAAAVTRGMSGRNLPSRNRGVKSARFAVLKGAQMPAVLIEVGFISHPKEERRLDTPYYRQKLAEGIRDGVVSFKENYEVRYAQKE